METYEDMLRRAFDPEAFRRLGRQVVDMLADHLASANPDIRRRVYPHRAPEEVLTQWADRFGPAPGVGLSELLPEILAGSIDLVHPRYVGHQCTTSLPAAALAGLVGQYLNNGSAVFEMGAVNVAMERHLIRWMAGLAGFGQAADGVFTSGGSSGNLTALLAARQWAAEGNVWSGGVSSGPPLAMLVSEQAHYCLRRAAAVMGLGEAAAIPVPVDERFRMRVDRLEAAWAEAERAGRRPFVVVANACSTATGSYDDLQAVGEFARRRGVWFHVDGAHGAGALLSEEYRHLLRGVEQADSLVWDAHKTLLMPALITGVVFRDGQRSYEAFSQHASYLFEGGAREEWYNYAHRTLECTKNMMGLRLFVSLAMYGSDFFAAYVTSRWSLAREFARMLREAPDFELAVEPESNIVCFRHLSHGAADADALQRRIRRRLLERGEFYIVQTELRGSLWLRCTLINPRTTRQDLVALLDAIRDAAGSSPA